MAGVGTIKACVKSQLASAGTVFFGVMIPIVIELKTFPA
jgi:hypothetical protein